MMGSNDSKPENWKDADTFRKDLESLLDIHALTAENPQWFTKDGVHPDREGAAAIAQAVYNAIS